MKVVFMGTPDFSVGTLEALVEAGYEITGVVTQPKNTAFRSISRAACGMQRRSRRSGKWSRM